MGFLKKFNQSNKKEEKELQEKAEAFKKRLLEISEEYGMQIIPIITRYGLDFEVRPWKKPEIKNQ